MYKPSGSLLASTSVSQCCCSYLHRDRHYFKDLHGYHFPCRYGGVFSSQRRSCHAPPYELSHPNAAETTHGNDLMQDACRLRPFTYGPRYLETNLYDGIMLCSEAWAAAAIVHFKHKTSADAHPSACRLPYAERLPVIAASHAVDKHNMLSASQMKRPRGGVGSAIVLKVRRSIWCHTGVS